MLDENALRARFWELRDQKDKIEAEARPLRDEYNVLQAEADAIRNKQQAVAQAFKAVEAPLFDIDMEIAQIARALKGKTGPRPEGP